MGHLYDLGGLPLTWEQLEERRQAYYAWKAAQGKPAQDYIKRKSGKGWNWVPIR